MLRVTESMTENCDFYDAQWKTLVGQTIQRASQAEEIRRLFSRIRQNAQNLKVLFLTEAEQDNICAATKTFDDKMQNMMHITFGNLEKYQMFGWKELIDKGEDA
jgi:hypothetical protein